MEHWRDFVEHPFAGFRWDECVLLTPRLARLTFKPPFLPYFAVRTAWRAFIYEEVMGLKVPHGAVMRHMCIWREKDQLDSRGLCINPLHLCLGTKANNTYDAYQESAVRDVLGFWQPTTTRPDHQEEHRRWCQRSYHGTPALEHVFYEPKSPVAPKDVMVVPQDQVWLRSARALLRAIRFNQEADQKWQRYIQNLQ